MFEKPTVIKKIQHTIIQWVFKNLIIILSQKVFVQYMNNFNFWTGEQFFPIWYDSGIDINR